MIDGYLSASFDLLNVADLDVIDQARAQCDQLTVGVFSDEYVERTMGRKPVVALEERIALLRHVRGVDHVVVHDDVDLSRLSADGTSSRLTAFIMTTGRVSGCGRRRCGCRPAGRGATR